MECSLVLGFSALSKRLLLGLATEPVDLRRSFNKKLSRDDMPVRELVHQYDIQRRWPAGGVLFGNRFVAYGEQPAFT